MYAPTPATSRMTPATRTSTPTKRTPRLPGDVIAAVAAAGTAGAAVGSTGVTGAAGGGVAAGTGVELSSGRSSEPTMTSPHRASTLPAAPQWHEPRPAGRQVQGEVDRRLGQRLRKARRPRLELRDGHGLRSWAPPTGPSPTTLSQLNQRTPPALGSPKIIESLHEFKRSGCQRPPVEQIIVAVQATLHVVLVGRLGPWSWGRRLGGRLTDPAAASCRSPEFVLLDGVRDCLCPQF